MRWQAKYQQWTPFTRPEMVETKGSKMPFLPSFFIRLFAQHSIFFTQLDAYVRKVMLIIILIFTQDGTDRTVRTVPRVLRDHQEHQVGGQMKCFPSFEGCWKRNYVMKNFTQLGFLQAMRKSFRWRLGREVVLFLLFAFIHRSWRQERFRWRPRHAGTKRY